MKDKTTICVDSIRGGVQWSLSLGGGRGGATSRGQHQREGSGEEVKYIADLEDHLNEYEEEFEEGM